MVCNLKETCHDKLVVPRCRPYKLDKRAQVKGYDLSV